MPGYWLHVNHPNHKAVIHVDEGCSFVRRAAKRVRNGEPYGPIRGDENGYWEEFATLHAAQVAQQATGKTQLGRCQLCPLTSEEADAELRKLMEEPEEL